MGEAKFAPRCDVLLA